MKGKKLISILISLVMLLTCVAGLDFPVFALASSGSCGDNVNYTFNSSTGTLVISGTGDMAIYEDAKSPFYNDTSIKKVIIEEGVTYVGQNAFQYCTGLTEAYIAEGVTSIGFQAFYQCTALTKVEMPESLVGVKNGSFYGCKELKEITMPVSATVGSASTFANCTKIETVNLLKGTGLAIQCTSSNYNQRPWIVSTSLKNINIEDGVTRLGTYMFYSLKNDVVVDIPNSVDTIYSNTFGGTTSRITINYHGTRAMWDAINTIPEAITVNFNEVHNFVAKKTVQPTCVTRGYIEYKCSECGYETVEYPINMASGPHDFGDGSELNCLICGEVNNENILTGLCGDDVRYALDKTTGELVISGTGDMFIYENDESPFYGNPDIKKVIIEEGVTYVGAAAFPYCTGLKEVYIAEGVTSIGFQAFYQCTALTKVEMPESLVGVKNGSFYGCKELKEITMPVSATVGSASTFANCTKIETVNLLKGTGLAIQCTSSNYNQRPWIVSTSLKNINIEDGVTRLGTYMFYSLKNDVVVDIPNSVDTIYPTTFGGTTSRITINYHGTRAMWDAINTLPDTITVNFNEVHNYIVEKTVQPTCKSRGYVEYKCSECANEIVEYPDELAIGEHDFGDGSESNCLVCGAENSSKIQKGSCGDNVTYTFNKSTGLLVISGTGDMAIYENDESPFYGNPDIKKVIIEEGVTYVGAAAFPYCTGLTEVYIAEGVTSIGFQAFYQCTALTKVELPESLVGVKNGSFYGCKELKEITMPVSATVGSASTFANCTKIETVNLLKGTGRAINCTESNYTQRPWIVSTRLKNINIEDGVTHLGTYMFYSLKNDVVIEIPNSVNSIEKNTFGGTTSRITINYHGTRAMWDAMCNMNGIVVTFNEIHNYVNIDTVQPTCANDGYLVFFCDECGDEYREYPSELAKGQHKDSEIVIENVVEATCTRDGSYDEVVYCTECLQETYRANRTTDKLGHSFTNYVSDNNASYTQDGTKTAKCDRCDATDTVVDEGSMLIPEETEDNTISLGAVELSAGERVSIPVNISNNAGIMGFKLMFEYDSAVLTPVSVTYGNVFSTGLSDNIEGNSRDGLFAVYWYSSQNTYTNGTLAYLNFDVNKNAVGSTTINVLYSQADTFAESAEGEIVETLLSCKSAEFEIVNTDCEKYYIGTMSAFDKKGNVIVSGDNDSASQINAGDIINVRMSIFDASNGGADLTKATHKISFDNNAFEFVGFANMSGDIISYASNKDSVDVVVDGDRVYDLSNPYKKLLPLGQMNLVFKAVGETGEAPAMFDYEIVDFAGVDFVEAKDFSIAVSKEKSDSTFVKCAEGVIGNYGERITVPVKITNNNGIMGYGITVGYNANHLELISINEAGYGGNLYTNQDNTLGEGYIIWFSNDEINTDGTLFNLVFEVVAEDAVESEIRVIYSNDDTFDGNYDYVELNCVGTTVKLNVEDEHTFVKHSYAGDCETQAYDEYVCSGCGYSYVEILGGEISNHEYHCTSYTKGELTYKCNKCNNIITKTADDVYAMWDNNFLNENREFTNNSTFVDVDDDSFINARDYAIIRNCMRR